MAKILVIDDEAPIRANLRRFLTLEGHEVIEAENGRAGLEQVRRERPDLVLCDLVMQELDGYAVLAALLSDPATACVPFVFLTASADRAEMAQALARGARAYLTKPFRLDDLAKLLPTLLPGKAG